MQSKPQLLTPTLAREAACPSCRPVPVCQTSHEKRGPWIEGLRLIGRSELNSNTPKVRALRTGPTVQAQEALCCNRSGFLSGRASNGATLLALPVAVG